MSDVIVPDLNGKLAYAMSYVRRGWHVFVLGAGRTPLPNCIACRDAGPEHDREACACLVCHGFYAATLDVDRINMMLTLYPEGGLAVRTGQPSNIIVLDCEGDGEPTGTDVLDAWESWVDADWCPNGTIQARTPSGGLHLFYEWVPGVKSRNRVLPGVDVKSDGGYVAVPCGEPGRTWTESAIESPRPPSPALASWLRSARGMARGGPGGSAGHSGGYDYQEFVKTGCPGGMRDEFFNDMCFRLRRAGATKEEAESQLRAAWSRCQQPPDTQWFMPWEHVEYKLHRVWQTVAQDDPTPSWTGGGDGGGPPLVVVEPDGGDEHFHPSDTGNAQRFIRLHGESVRYSPEMKNWLLWDGNRWVIDKMNRVLELTRDIADHVRRQADLEQDAEHQRLLARHALSCEGARARKNALDLAAVDSRMVVDIRDLNRDPLQLVVKNGVLNLRTGELTTARREDLNTQQAAVTYDPDAVCPRWREHVKFVTNGDIVLASYLRRAIGYSLTGLVREQSFFMLEGTGANGKNAFIEPVVALLGDYAQVGTSALITGGDEQHPTILADLVGARLVFIDESRQGRPLNVERVKQLTGSKKIKARRMGQDFFQFDAQLKLWIAGNNHPTMKDSSDGIWRRLHRVMFSAKVGDDVKIADYGQLLYEEEGPGILNWAIDGLRDWWQLQTLGQPDAVTRSTAELRDEEDVIAQWLEERVVITLDENDRVPSSTLYTDFCMWAGMAGVAPSDRPNRTQFGRALGAKKLERWMARVDGRVTRGFAGIRLGGVNSTY